MLLVRTDTDRDITAAGEGLRLRGPRYRYLLRAPETQRWSGDRGRAAAVAGDIPSEGLAAAKALTAEGALGRRAGSPFAMTGDFCAALVEPEDDRLVLIASRLGLPQLYVFRPGTGGTLLASDDLDLLLETVQALGHRLNVDRAYVAWHMTGLPGNPLATAPNPTIYRQIATVPPGTYVTSDSFEQATRYWRFWDGPRISKRSRRGLPALVRETFLAAVADRTDIGATGVLLSGGLDSSAVAGGIRRNTAQPIHCYTNVFDRAGSPDERFFAEAVAKHTGAIGRLLRSDEHWALKDVPDPSRRPQPEPYQVWFYAQEKTVAETARADGVTTILDGMGGDELFGTSMSGNRYQSPEATEAIRHRTRDTRRGRSQPPIPVIDRAVVPSFATDTLVKEVDLFDRIRQPLADLADATDDPVTEHRLFSFYYMGDTVSDCTWAQREVYRPKGIVQRHPFLDHRLVEIVFGVPINVLVAPALKKVLLRSALGGLLPEVVARRKRDFDYSFAIHRGYREEGARLLGMMQDALVYELGFVAADSFAPHLSDLVRGNVMRSLAGSFHEMHIWQVITLELWLRGQVATGRLAL